MFIRPHYSQLSAHNNISTNLPPTANHIPGVNCIYSPFQVNRRNCYYFLNLHFQD